jgi:hypothetical protein
MSEKKGNRYQQQQVRKSDNSLPPTAPSNEFNADTSVSKEMTQSKVERKKQLR